MKHVTRILIGSVAVGVAAWVGIAYLGGRLGRPLAIGPFPVQILPVLFAALSLVSLFGRLLFVLIKGRQVKQLAVASTVAVLICLVGFSVSPAKVFRMGFRHRIVATVTTEELRRIASVARQTIAMDGRLPGPEKSSLWNESEHRAQWTALAKDTALNKLDLTLTIFNGPNAVTISWGGALVGHWGVIIQTDGRSGVDDIASDIATFISSD